MKHLLADSRECVPVVRYRELRDVRAHLVVRCFHKLANIERSRELVTLLEHGYERESAQKALGTVSLDFTYNNPTGFFRLDLSDATQREICLRLMEYRNDLQLRLQQLKAYFWSRKGGRREDENDHPDLERVWRNARFNILLPKMKSMA